MKTTGVLRYDTRSIAADYVRAAFGAVVCLAPPVFMDVAAVLAWVLVAVGALFVAFGLRTMLRHLTTYELSQDGMRARGPLGATVSWTGSDSHQSRLLPDAPEAQDHRKVPERLDGAHPSRRAAGHQDRFLP